MNDTRTSKADLRRQMKLARDGVAVAQRMQWSDAIARRVLAMPAVLEADRVFCYVSFGSEVDTHDLIRRLLAMGKTVAVPRLTKQGEGADGRRDMIAQPIESLEDLKPGLYGFLQPPEVSPTRHLPCPVTLVPGLAFTPGGDRLGYGAGHYDRYFASHPETVAIGLCFHHQLMPRLPVEPFDRPMQSVVTEGDSPVGL